MEKKKIGFALLPPEKRKEMAAKGGANVPAHKRSFSTVDGLASRAGSKGGVMVDPANRSFSQYRELAQRAGAKGGKQSQLNKKNRNNVNK